MHPEPDPQAEVVLFNRHDVVADPAPVSSAEPSAGMFGVAPALSSHNVDAGPYGSALRTNPYESGLSGIYLPPIPALPRWAAQVLDESDFAVPEGVTPPAIWSQYQRAVDSIPDQHLRSSVLRAGWLALHDEMGED